MARKIDEDELNELDISTAGNIVKTAPGLHTNIAKPIVNASRKITQSAVRTIQNRV